MTSNTPVEVFIRVRPGGGEGDKVQVSKKVIKITNPRNQDEQISYSFNQVFDEKAKQSDLWLQCKPIILKALEGKNCSLFAYGQTGSGKTYTMMNEGIIQSTIAELLKHQKYSSISASYLEIYNEKIYDLLSDTQTFLDLRQNGKEMVLPGVTVASISSIDDFNRQLSLSLKNRSTASTSLNSESSRSHFILQLQVTNFSAHVDVPVTSKIHLIDLAGSEDNKRTGNSGQRMDESCAINKSLFVLGQVVEALNKGLARVPFRDSKITRFLQDSLGGSAHTLLIACVSPKACDLYDTYNTLNFATKSSLIKNVVTVNEAPAAPIQQPKKSDASLERLEALKEWKKNKDGTMKSSNPNAGPTAKRVPMNQSVLPDTTQALTEKLKNELSLKLAREVELTIEERVNARIKEIADNFMSSSTFQKAVSEKYQEVHGKMELKLKSLETRENKENVNTTPVPQGKSISTSLKPILIDSPDLEELKESTRQKILHIVNRGNVKSLMVLKTIGKKRAELILGARDEGGEFGSLEDLTRAGLKPSQIEALFKSNMDF